MSCDLVIRNGMVVDGTGAPAFHADVAIMGGRIAALGRVTEKGRREIDADGHIVSPGFIDGHTHMDAQVHWDPFGTCSSWHGVTTVVMGNCGFTLAPVRADQRALVVRNLERAEDISAAAMAQGIEWRWESFPEYMDALDALPKGINYATYVGHSALRTFAMNERAFDDHTTEDDLRCMEDQLRAALQAGALGFTTSRTNNHETSDNRPVASRLASWSEVERLVKTMGRCGGGIFELAPEPAWAAPEAAQRGDFFARIGALAMEPGVTVTLPTIPGPVSRAAWQAQLELMERVRAEGGRMFGQAHVRGVTILLSFLSQLPFDGLPEWRKLRAQPIDAQKLLLRDPALRARLVHEAHHGSYGHAIGPEARKPDWNQFYLFDQPLPPYPTVRERAAQRGLDPVELMIELALESDFCQFFLQYLGPAPDPQDLLAIMRHPLAVTTFSDAGAHVGQISDASLQVYLLAYWARERKALSLEEAVRMVTAVPADAWGFADRGRIQVGMAADLNVFDFAHLMPGMPRVAHDLPGNARRLLAQAEGMRATIVGGEVLMENGACTGALPGRLLRSTRPARPS